jgi:hypothetical protein
VFGTPVGGALFGLIALLLIESLTSFQRAQRRSNTQPDAMADSSASHEP